MLLETNSAPMLLGIDFDGVLHDSSNPVAGRRMGPPMFGARESMQQLRDAHHILVVFTTRGSEAKRAHVEAWLRFYGIPFDRVTDIKENYDWIIDDHALSFTTWRNTLHELGVPRL